MRKSVLMRMIVMAIAIVMVTGIAIAMSACGHEHKFGEWVVYKKATCTQTGVQYRTCECGEEEQKNIPAIGHTEGDWVVDIEPSCIEEGSKSKRCTVCSAAIKNVSVDKLGHDYSTEWTVDVEPTCTEKGSKSHHCSRCEDKKDVTKIPANGHSDGEWITDIDPTCTADGSKHQICSVCNDIIATDVIAPLGHKLGEWTQTLAPACTEKGSERGDCSVCEHFETRDIDAFGHKYGEWIQILAPTCTEKGSERRDCSACEHFETRDINVLGHNHSAEWTVDVEPTCTMVGCKSHHCSRCEDRANITEVPANGHSYSITIVNRDCGNNGKKVYTCGTCEHSYDEEINSIEISFRHTSTSSTTVNGYGSYAKGYSITVTGGYGTILLKYELYTSATATNPTSTIDFTTDTATSVSFRGYANAIDNYVYKITAKDEVGNISVYRFSLKDESLIDYIHKGEIEHSFSEWSVTRESTCSEYGEKQSTCSVCNNTVTDIVEKKPHTVVVDEAVPSNCVRRGLTEGRHCSVCETVIVAQTETPVGEHSYENKTCICGRDVTIDAIATYDLSNNQDGSIIGYLTKTKSGQKLYVFGKGAIKNYGSSGAFVSPFYKNKNLTEVYIGEGITSIGDCLFWFCTMLNVVNIPQSTISIGSYSFVGCSLTNLTLPEGLVKIFDSAFEDNQFSNIVFPTSLEYIGKSAFRQCNMSSVYIPQNVSFIGADAFSWSDLYEITVDENNPKYHSKNNCIIDTSAKTLIVGCKNSTIPSDGSVTCIGHSAFSGMKLSSVIIPGSITIIEDFAFSCCNFTQVVIPVSVNTIGDAAFFLCDGLTSITFDGTVEQWNAIYFGGTDWNYKVPATEVVCSDGVVKLN